MQVKYSVFHALIVGTVLFAWPNSTQAKKVDFRLSEDKPKLQQKLAPAAKTGRSPSSVVKSNDVPEALLSKQIPAHFETGQRRELCRRSFDTLTARDQCTTSVVSF